MSGGLFEGWEAESVELWSVRLGAAFQKCAEPWMAEQKRHMDVP